jgi:anti-sigma factor RsiW
MSDSDDQFDDELLSAYVDDELTPQERARVESRLRSDPHAARMVEELRSLSSAIKSLPRETLGRDLRAEVQADIDRAKAAAADDKHLLPPIAPYDRWAGYRRGLVWSAMAIAATLMLVMMTAKQAGQDERTVAKVNQREEAASDRRDAVDDNALPPMGSIEAPKDPQPSSPAPGLRSGSSSIAADPADSSSASSSVDGEADLSLKRELSRPMSGEELADPRRELQSPPSAGFEAESLDTLSDQDAAKSLDADSLAAAGPRGGARLLNELQTALPQTIQLAVTAPDGMARFKRLLSEQKIEFVEQPDNELGAKLSKDQVAARDGEESQPKASSSVEAKLEEHEEKLVETFNAPSPDASGLAVGAREAVMVEASPKQIEQLYFACLAESDAFADAPQGEDGAQSDFAQTYAFSKASTEPESESQYRFNRSFGGLGGGQQPEESGGAEIASTAPEAAAPQPAERAPARSVESLRRRGGEQSLGLAWSVPASQLADEGAAAPAVAGELKQKLAQRGGESDESGVQLRDAKARDKAETRAARPSISGKPQPAAPAQAAARPEKVRVLFVLRPLPATAAPATAPAVAAPAAK